MSFEINPYTVLWILAILDILGFVILFRHSWVECKEFRSFKNLVYMIGTSLLSGPLICFLYVVGFFMEKRIKSKSTKLDIL